MEDYLLLIAVIIDLVIGDPNWYPHPVVIMGRIISWLEERLRRVVTGPTGERIAGLILALLVIAGTYLITRQLIDFTYQIGYYLGVAVEVWVLASTIAITGLVEAAQPIYQALCEDNLESARTKLDLIVGRDTEQLTAEGIIRGVVETIAENTSDGVIAPLFYAVIGGAPLAMTYKAVNTLDSMLGYKNENYRAFGWAAARTDDGANFIPARLTGLLFVVSALFTGRHWKKAKEIILRDAAKHPSPNAGIPEAAVAGALNVRLGGVNYYHGEESFRAYLGDKEVEFVPQQIKDTIELMYWAAGLFVVGYYLLFTII